MPFVNAHDEDCLIADHKIPIVAGFPNVTHEFPVLVSGTGLEPLISTEFCEDTVSSHASGILIVSIDVVKLSIPERDRNDENHSRHDQESPQASSRSFHF